MSHSWLFYDVESSDLNPVFGQIMQYASIRDDQREVDRTMFYVQLTHDRILSPEAMLVHRIPVDYEGASYSESKAPRLCMIKNTPNTYNGGYNTLGYDDEVLRFTFYEISLTHIPMVLKMDVSGLIYFLWSYCFIIMIAP